MGTQNIEDVHPIKCKTIPWLVFAFSVELVQSQKSISKGYSIYEQHNGAGAFFRRNVFPSIYRIFDQHKFPYPYRPLPICGMTKGARAIFQLVSTVNASFITYLRKTIFPDYNPAIGKNSSETVMSSPVLQRAPAAERNKAPILETLKTILPVPSNNEKLQILEIASGTGQHIAHFAQSLPQVEWQPSEVSSTSLRSIEQYIAFYNLKNVKPPLMIDIVKPTGEWPSPLNSPQSLDAILCTNMIHITPWTCTEGLFSSANYLLKPGGLLITYGPYSVNGVLTPESNVNFDAGLRQQNPLWGIRDVKDLEQLGAQQKLELHQRFDLPANNKILVFRKVL